MSKDLILARFKANQGLSFSDISAIFDVDLPTARRYLDGEAPGRINKIALALNCMMERWKSERGVFNDVDYQHLAKNAENLYKENQILKEKIKAFEDAIKSNSLALENYEKSLDAEVVKSYELRALL